MNSFEKTLILGSLKKQEKGSDPLTALYSRYLFKMSKKKTGQRENSQKEIRILSPVTKVKPQKRNLKYYEWDPNSGSQGNQLRSKIHVQNTI